MKSQMTEREAREQISRAVGFAPKGDYADRMIDWARRAGLEFAPEPLPLPERFYFQEVMLFPGDMPPIKGAVLDCEAGGLLLFAAFDGGLEHYQEQYRLDATRRACERANAYPGLREKARRLADAMRNQSFSNEAYEAQRALADELARGPK